jgi:hypothetical protein
MRKFIILLFFCSFYSDLWSAADSLDRALIPFGFSDAGYEVDKISASTLSDQTNVGKMAFILLIRFYQKVFSSNDGPTCQFRPSCSHFASQAVKEYGPFRGVLMASDRLLRCNPYTLGKYPQYSDQYHYADPVEDHLLTVQ